MSQGEKAPMPIGLDYFQLQVGQWANDTFPKSTPHTIARHLFREAVELCFATMQDDDPHLAALITSDLHRELSREWVKHNTRTVRGDPHAVAAESADVFLLTLHLAHKSGFGLLAVGHTKHEANQARAWGEPDAAGVVEHVREED